LQSKFEQQYTTKQQQQRQQQQQATIVAIKKHQQQLSTFTKCPVLCNQIFVAAVLLLVLLQQVQLNFIVVSLFLLGGIY
jgi:hypothetical protein